MALHFAEEEYAARLARLTAKMQEEKLDAILLFAQESMYWLTGYDTFGYCFFQSLVVKRDGSMVLLTRSADPGCPERHADHLRASYPARTFAAEPGRQHGTTPRP